MFDLISIGDARIDNFIKIEEAHIHCVKERCEICLLWGSKIPVEELQTMPAGNNNNNAVGASRLGLKTAIYTNVGQDAGGRHLIEHLKEEKVSIKYVVTHPAKVTENSYVLDFHGERTILVYHEGWDFQLPELDQTKWVYFSSVAPSFVKSNLVKQLEQYLERTGSKLVYSPGTHQLKHGVKKYPKLLALTKLFILNKEEAKIVLEYDLAKDVPIRRLLQELADLGPQNVVITDAGEGSYGFDGDRYWKLRVFPAKLVEMTGAGDAYATGTLAGLFYGRSLFDAMRWGAANAASVVEQVGAQAGLLTYDQIQRRLKENPKIIAREI